MPTVTKIDRYEVRYSDGNFSPKIYLWSGSTFLSQLNFLPNGFSPLPPDTDTGGFFVLHYHLDDFANCIDLLRNEGPVHLFWVGPGALNENAIVTSAETVGEGE